MTHQTNMEYSPETQDNLDYDEDTEAIAENFNTLNIYNYIG